MALWGKLEAGARTGTISVASANTAVTGSGTLFQTELKLGDVITSATQEFVVTAIASNTALTVGSPAGSAISGQAYTVTQVPKYLNPSEKVAVDLVTTANAQDANNRVNGVKTPGWTLYSERSTGPGGTITRRRVETLIPLKS